MSYEWYVVLYAAVRLLVIAVPRQIGDQVLVGAGMFAISGLLLNRSGVFTLPVEIVTATGATLFLFGVLYAVRYHKPRAPR